MGAAGSWLLAVTAAAMLVAMAEELTPKGAVRKIGRLTGGLVLLIAVLQPVLKLDYADLSAALSRCRDDLGSYEAQAGVENFTLMKSIIEARSGAYIQDKAAELGIHCEVQVTCAAGSWEEMPYPAQVTVRGTLSREQRQRLQVLIEGELAIPAGQQSYETTEEEGT